MGSKIHTDPGLTSFHNHEILASVHDSSFDAAKESMIYSYKHSFRGFSAKLSSDQAASLARRPDVVAVFKSEIRNLHTTRSWEFLGLPASETGGIPHSASNHRVIVGLLDTGIWPESKSFRDDMMPPVPRRWKGECMPGENFTAEMCNRKVIGAKHYLKGLESEIGPLVSFADGGSDILSARDVQGHGSHTASTAAGRLVTGINLQGQANGAARGGAPRARIAVYKVCWSQGCFDADILAAFDDAIKDGVDVLSLSLGPDPPQNDYFMDAISIGSFHAMQKGITVVGSVGNNGPMSSATNAAPWILTVGSTSIDRDFLSSLILDTHVTVKGESLAQKQMRKNAAIVYGGEAATRHFTPQQSSFCINGSLDPTKVRNKIVVCKHPQDVREPKLPKSLVVQAAGGAGMILIDELGSRTAVQFVIPALIVGNKGGQTILTFLNKTKSNAGTGFISPPSTVLGIKPAPQVSYFSSRGPNGITPDILKPDIAGPGLNILAAWSPLNGPDYNIVSGTSMSCPHLSGISLLLKASHPSWSPAAIKSAMITTAFVSDNENKPITCSPTGVPANPFDIGAGQVDPKRAQNPGLIYDATADDFIDFLCSTGYDTATLRLITADQTTRCPKAATTKPMDLNYASIAVSRLSGKQRVMRTVTNVGEARSEYAAFVEAPAGVYVKVVPEKLQFTSYGQKLSFWLEFTVLKPTNDYVFGALIWSNGKQRVRSPLALYTV